MIRVLFDANVLASLSTSDGGTLFELLRRGRNGDFLPVISDALLDEVLTAWSKPYWLNRLTEVERERLIIVIRDQSEMTKLTIDVRGIAHPEDDLVLAAAESANVDYLVTGDSELLDLGAHEGIPIITARQFLAILNRR